MIKKIFIISSLLFIGCDQLVEKTSPLDGIYYILDGWQKFEEGDYNRAHDLFSTVLLDGASQQYFDDAYVGLAWNSIYKANTIQGSNNLFDREYQRNISNEYITLALENLDESCPVSNINCSLFCQNLLAARIYNSSYQALESSRKFYDIGLDSSNYINMINYSNITLSISEVLLNHCNSEYIFEHDSLITSDAIRILRAQTYIRLGDLDSAEAELLLINYCEPDETIFECLNVVD